MICAAIRAERKFRRQLEEFFFAVSQMTRGNFAKISQEICKFCIIVCTAPPHEFHTPKKKISYHSPEGVDLWGCQLLAHRKHVVSASLVDILSYLLFHYVYYAPLLRGGPKPLPPCVPPRAQLTVAQGLGAYLGP